MTSTKIVTDGQWSTGLISGACDDPLYALMGYCNPCCLYGRTAEKVHGPEGSCISHCLKFMVYSACFACGLVAGPTRAAVRHKYNLPVEPSLLESQGTTGDCIVSTVPCCICLSISQTAREVNNRGVTAANPISPTGFEFGPASFEPTQEMTMSK